MSRDTFRNPRPLQLRSSVRLICPVPERLLLLGQGGQSLGLEGARILPFDLRNFSNGRLAIAVSDPPLSEKRRIFCVACGNRTGVMLSIAKGANVLNAHHRNC